MMNLNSKLGSINKLISGLNNATSVSMENVPKFSKFPKFKMEYGGLPKRFEHIKAAADIVGMDIYEIRIGGFITEILNGLADSKTAEQFNKAVSIETPRLNIARFKCSSEMAAALGNDKERELAIMNYIAAVINAWGERHNVPFLAVAAMTRKSKKYCVDISAGARMGALVAAMQKDKALKKEFTKATNLGAVFVAKPQ